MDCLPQYLQVDLVDPPKNLTTHCCACQQFLTQPIKLSPCRHIVCSDCSLKYYENCPKCQSIITNGDNDNILLQQLLELKSKCKCGEEFSLIEYANHIKDCTQALISCPNGCGYVFLQSEKQNHLEQQCLARMISCKHCGTILAFQQLDEHVTNCPKVLVQCNYCSSQVERSYICQHSQQCPEYPVPCFLCHDNILRKELHAHLNSLDNLGIHLTHIFDTFVHTQQQFSKIHQELTGRLSKIENKMTSVANHLNNQSKLKSNQNTQLLSPKQANLKDHQFNRAFSNNMNGINSKPMSQEDTTHEQSQENLSGKILLEDNNVEVTRAQSTGFLQNPVQMQEMQQPLMDGDGRNIRTSLRIVPGQEIGTERLNSLMLVVPDDMIANNDFQVTTVPPTEKVKLEIYDVLKQTAIMMDPVVKRNNIYFKVRLPQGDYKFSVKQENNVLDDADVTVVQQQMLDSPYNINYSADSNLISHTFMLREPIRAFVQISDQVKQTFFFKINKLNCFAGFGFTQSKERRLSTFEILCNNGQILTRENKQITSKQTQLILKQYDIVCIDFNLPNEIASIYKKGEDGTKIIFDYTNDTQFYIEVVDAELILL